MELKQELSSSAIQQDFLAYAENTMGAELGANVGLVLLNLARHFSGNPAPDFSKAIISPEKVDSYLAALAEKINEQDEATQEAWKHVKKKLEEASNGLDRITVYQDGKEIEHCFDLKTALALVYAALTDKDTFWEAAKKQLTTQKEIITDHEAFEENYAKDEAARLSTLWNCFKDLRTKRICHTGIRNEFAMTLNGTYPDVWFIESLEAFLHDLIAEHIHRLIEDEKAEPGLYCESLLAEMCHERSASINKALEASKSDLRQTIEQALVKHGINPKNCSHKIANSLAAIEDVTLSFESNPLMSSLSFILKPSLQAEEKYLLMVKAWIKEAFVFDYEPCAIQVISFAKVQKTLALFKKYQTALRGWNEEFINLEQLELLGKELEAYQKGCLQLSSPQPISEELDLAMQGFAQACAAFKRDTQYDWIENFFIQWAVAKEETRTQLYSKLYDVSMQEKFLVSTRFLDSQFSQTGPVVEITPYLINRIFLQALVLHPGEWEPDFFKYLTEVYKFVSQKLSDEQQEHGAEALRRDSYPQVLLEQLWYLQDYYQFLQDNQNEPAGPYFFSCYVPMKQFIQTSSQFYAVITYLPATQLSVFIGSLSEEFLRPLISTSRDLAWDLRNLSEAKKQALMNSLSYEFLKSMIIRSHDFALVVGQLSGIQKEDFIDFLGHEFLKSIIRNNNELAIVLSHLSEAQKQAIIGKAEFLQSLIKARFDLGCWLEKYLSPSQIPVFIDSLGSEFLKSIIQNFFQLRELTKNLSKVQKQSFLGALGHEFLKSIMCSSYDLQWLLGQLSETQRQAFLDSSEPPFLKSIIYDSNSLFVLVCLLPITQREVFLDFLGYEFLISMLRSGHDLGPVLGCLSETQIPSFISSLGDGPLKSMIEDCDVLNLALANLSGTPKKIFLDYLGYEFLRSLIKNSNNLDLLLGHLFAAQKELFLDYLGHEFLKSMTRRSNSFDLVAGHLTEKQKEAFMGFLGDKFLKSMIRCSNDFDLIARHLTVKKEAFMDFLGNKFLKSMLKYHVDLGRVLKHLSEARIKILASSLDQNFLKSINRLNLASVLKGLSETQIPAFVDYLANGFLSSLIKAPDDLDWVLKPLSEEQQQAFLGSYDKTEQLRRIIRKFCNNFFFSQENQKGRSEEVYEQEQIAVAEIDIYS